MAKKPKSFVVDEPGDDDEEFVTLDDNKEAFDALTKQLSEMAAENAALKDTLAKAVEENSDLKTTVSRINERGEMLNALNRQQAQSMGKPTSFVPEQRLGAPGQYPPNMADSSDANSIDNVNYPAPEGQGNDTLPEGAPLAKARPAKPQFEDEPKTR